MLAIAGMLYTEALTGKLYRQPEVFNLVKFDRVKLIRKTKGVRFYIREGPGFTTVITLVLGGAAISHPTVPHLALHMTSNNIIFLFWVNKSPSSELYFSI
jgi:hypothetical protein